MPVTRTLGTPPITVTPPVGIAPESIVGELPTKTTSLTAGVTKKSVRTSET
jgi:hypothetical protein